MRYQSLAKQVPLNNRLLAMLRLELLLFQKDMAMKCDQVVSLQMLLMAWMIPKMSLKPGIQSPMQTV